MKRHDLDVLSLVFGLLFTAAAGWYFLSQLLNIRVSLPNGGWLVAGVLIVLGVLGVGASLRHNTDEPTPEESLDDTRS
jgi:hypothetical protein